MWSLMYCPIPRLFYRSLAVQRKCLKTECIVHFCLQCNVHVLLITRVFWYEVSMAKGYIYSKTLLILINGDQIQFRLFGDWKKKVKHASRKSPLSKTYRKFKHNKNVYFVIIWSFYLGMNQISEKYPISCISSWFFTFRNIVRYPEQNYQTSG